MHVRFFQILCSLSHVRLFGFASRQPGRDATLRETFPE
jgi:hypothetical protein